MSQPQRQAFALAYAMQKRPTPALASRYFEALKTMLDNVSGDNNMTGAATPEGTACRTRSIQRHC